MKLTLFNSVLNFIVDLKGPEEILSAVTQQIGNSTIVILMTFSENVGQEHASVPWPRVHPASSSIRQSAQETRKAQCLCFCI